MPSELIDALIASGPRELTIVNNNAGNGEVGLAALLKARRVRKIICSFPRSSDPVVFETLYRAGKIELEIVPQGTLSERMRAGAAGLGGFYVKTAAGTKLGHGKETREIDGETYVLEKPIKGDLALCRADRSDRWGNLTFRKSARNFNPVMAMAGAITAVQVREIVALGEIDPECVVTPGIFVDRIVVV
jgi:3-oxoadipate CoA-transferase alpha subunit